MLPCCEGTFALCGQVAFHTRVGNFEGFGRTRPCCQNIFNRWRSGKISVIRSLSCYTLALARELIPWNSGRRNRITFEGTPYPEEEGSRVKILTDYLCISFR